MYLDAADVRMVVEHLDADGELAWLASAGEGCWRAQTSHPTPLLVRSALWHIPSGPLPVVPPRLPGSPATPPTAREWVSDPWRGWRERRSGSDPYHPYFGPGWPGTYLLNLQPQTEAGELAISSFEWIGNRYAILGEPAAGETERHWRGLRGWVRRHAEKVTRSGPLKPTEGRTADIFAFPAALAAIEAGAERARNPRPAARGATIAVS